MRRKPTGYSDINIFLVSEDWVGSPNRMRRGMVTRDAKAAETRRWTAH